MSKYMHCPVCGYEFEEHEIEVEPFACLDCDTSDAAKLCKDDLIGDDDDYLWCL